MGYLKSTGTVFIYIGLFLALVTFLPNIPPDAQFSEFSVISPQSGLTNDPKLNTRLDNVEILLKGEVKGPESFASYNGELYSGVHGGDIVKIVGKHIVPIVKFGKPCDGFWMEKECGRPLGLQFDKNGILYVVDSYNGIFKVDVTSGNYEKLIDISKPIEGTAPKLINSLDIASNGDIYWSDSSSEFSLQDGVYTTLANPSGRLIRYDAAAKRNIVLVGNLGFANGVKLSKDESFVVVAETMVSRLTRVHLKGNKAGRAEPFVQGLPGLPDNIHTDGEDGFLVGLVITADADHPTLVHSLAPHPYIRKMLARLIYLIEAPFKLIEDVYPNYYSKRAVHWIGHFESIQFLHWGNVGVLRIDAGGKIVDAAFSSNAKLDGVSSGFIFKDHIYLGSPYSDYLARVPVSQAFPSIKPKAENIAQKKVIEKREVKEPPKPVVQAKPTTTTSPPTTTTTTTTTPKPKPARTTTTPAPTTTTQRPTTAAPTTTTQRPPTAAPTTTPPPPKQQQQQAPPKPSKPLKEAGSKPARQAPASPPPPANKVPAKEAPSPTQQGGQKQTVTEPSPKSGQQASPQAPSKPASNEQGEKNARKTDDAAKKPEQNPGNVQKPVPSGNGQKSPPPSNAQKPSNPAPVTGQQIKDTKPPVTTTPPSPPRK